MVKKFLFSFISFLIFSINFSYAGDIDASHVQALSQDNDISLLHKQLDDPLLSPDELESRDALEESYNQLVQFLVVIDNALEHLALVTNNNQIRNLTKKQDKIRAIQHIFEVRKYIDLKKKPIMKVTPHDYAALSKTVLALARYVHEMIAKGLKDIPPFVEPVITRSQAIDIEHIEKDIIQATKLVNTLEQKANNVGLSKFNRAFRKLEEWDHKYKLKRKLLWTIGGLIVGSYLVYKLEPSYFEKLHFWNKNDEDWESLSAQDTSHEPQKTLQEDPAALKKLKDEDPEKYLSQLQTQLAEAKLAKYRQHGYSSGNSPWYKRLFGDPYDVQTRGIWNHIESALTARLGLVAFSSAGAWFVLPEHLKEPTIEWFKHRLAWAQKKLGIMASYLRGGPVKRMLSDFEQELKASFDDVIGNDEVKKALQPIIDYVANYKNRDRSGIIPSTGILFIGAPRTGKSFFAEALAFEIKRNSPEQIRLLGFTAAELKEFGITKLFTIIQEAAQETGPMVIVIDEIDTIGLKRPGTGAKDNPVLCEFLTVLSNLNRQKNNKIVVIACTNKPEDLDDALKEPGRFGIHIHFKYPNEEDRKEFLIRELSNRTIYIEPIFIDTLAHMTDGCSFDALNQLLISALQQAKIQGRVLTQQDLEQAYYQHINRIVFTENTIPDTEQQVIALHQAGEVLVREALNTKKRTSIATIYAVNPSILHNSFTGDNPHNLKQDRTKFGQVFTVIDKNSVQGELKGTLNALSLPTFFTHADCIDEIKALVAGSIAELIVNDTNALIYQQHNREKALEIAKYIVLQGMPDNADYPQAYREQKLADALRIVDECQKEVKEILSTRINELVALANALYTHKLLTYQQIQDVFEQSKNNQDQPALSVDDLLADGATVPASDNKLNEVTK